MEFATIDGPLLTFAACGQWAWSLCVVLRELCCFVAELSTTIDVYKTKLDLEAR
jgi:hypothetical protein